MRPPTAVQQFTSFFDSPAGIEGLQIVRGRAGTRVSVASLLQAARALTGGGPCSYRRRSLNPCPALPCQAAMMAEIFQRGPIVCSIDSGEPAYPEHLSNHILHLPVVKLSLVKPPSVHFST